MSECSSSNLITFHLPVGQSTVDIPEVARNLPLKDFGNFEREVDIADEIFCGSFQRGIERNQVVSISNVTDATTHSLYSQKMREALDIDRTITPIEEEREQNREKIYGFITTADKDGDGLLNYEEIVKGIEEYYHCPRTDPRFKFLLDAIPQQIRAQVGMHIYFNLPKIDPALYMQVIPLAVALPIAGIAVWSGFWSALALLTQTRRFGRMGIGLALMKLGAARLPQLLPRFTIGPWHLFSRTVMGQKSFSLGINKTVDLWRLTFSRRSLLPTAGTAPAWVQGKLTSRVIRFPWFTNGLGRSLDGLCMFWRQRSFTTAANHFGQGLWWMTRRFSFASVIIASGAAMLYAFDLQWTVFKDPKGWLIPRFGEPIDRRVEKLPDNMKGALRTVGVIP